LRAKRTIEEEAVAAMRAVGYHQLPRDARIVEHELEYTIELDVAEFNEEELTVEALGPVLTLRGDQADAPGDEGKPFRIQERLEASFRLPDDADLERIEITYKHGVLDIRVGRTPLESRTLKIERRTTGLLDQTAEAV
jgi:HSP20 family molecular chaperone IbpA